MARERGFSPRALDVAAFARQHGELAGHWPLASFGRLADSLAAPSDAPVHWKVRGHVVERAGAAAVPWLVLSLAAELPLTCQRCLQPLLGPVHVERRFRFVSDEDEAEREDEAAEEDVLALTARLDLAELVEDELILALPIVPRHEVCPAPLPSARVPAVDPLSVADPAQPERPHPFAALAALRRGRDSG